MKRVQAVLMVAIVCLSGCGSGSSTAVKPYANTDGYPLEICPVTGEKLGAMGEPFVIKYNGKTVKLCCSSCLKDFNKDSAKYMAILEEAEKKKASAK